MNKFEEFDNELGPSVEGLVPGALCAKIVVTFMDPEGNQISLGFLREGFKDPDDDTSKDIPLDEFGEPVDLYPEDDDE